VVRMSTEGRTLIALLAAGLAVCCVAPHAERAVQPAEVIEVTSEGVTTQVVLSQEGASDYKAVFYKKTQTGLVRIGSDFELVGFSRPVLRGGAHPAVWAQHVKSGEWYYFSVVDDTVELLPEQGEWEPLRPGVAAKRPSAGRAQ